MFMGLNMMDQCYASYYGIANSQRLKMAGLYSIYFKCAGVLVCDTYRVYVTSSMTSMCFDVNKLNLTCMLFGL